MFTILGYVYIYVPIKGGCAALIGEWVTLQYYDILSVLLPLVNSERVNIITYHSDLG